MIVISLCPKEICKRPNRSWKKRKPRLGHTYSELIFFGQSVYGKGCNALGQKFCFSNSIQLKTQNSKFQRAITKMKMQMKKNILSHHFDIQETLINCPSFQNENQNCKVLFYLLLNPDDYRIFAQMEIVLIKLLTVVCHFPENQT